MIHHFAILAPRDLGKRLQITRTGQGRAVLAASTSGCTMDSMVHLVIFALQVFNIEARSGQRFA